MIPKHLEPKTYWERRCDLVEGALLMTVQSLVNTGVPPICAERLRSCLREWNSLLGDLKEEFPPATEETQPPEESE